MRSPSAASAETHVLLRGNPTAPGDTVEPGVPEVLGGCAGPFASGAAASGERWPSG